MFEEHELVQQVRNADPMVMDALIHALCTRHDEINPESTALFFIVEKKRDICEQADEFIKLMQSLKEIDAREKKEAKVIQFKSKQ